MGPLSSADLSGELGGRKTTVPGDVVRALVAATRMLADVGIPIAAVTVAGTGIVQIRPRSLADGDEVARRLGLTDSTPHMHLIPPQREWCGRLDGMEVHVHSRLLSPGARR
ncbi:hypothetical protein GCM10027059_49900 [Myceligenerans halotolerans]